MKKDEKEFFDYVDSENVSHSVKISEDDFKLVQVDKSIHDTKFKNKPTTFFKDALKRFAKNKASVAGAIILGILLLSSFLVPVIDTNPVDGDRSVEQFLPAKLFPSGTGFWDGTKKYVNQVADETKIGREGTVNEGKVLPAKVENSFSVTEFNESYITNLEAPKIMKTNAPSKFAKGGQLLIRSTKIRHKEGIEDEDNINDSLVYYISPEFQIKLEDSYKFELDYQEEFIDTILNNKPGEYRLELRYGPLINMGVEEENKEDDASKNEEATTIDAETPEGETEEKPQKKDEHLPLRQNSIILKDFSKEDTSVTLKDAIEASGKTLTDEDLKSSNLVIVAKPSFEEDLVVPINSLKVTKKGNEINEYVSILNPSTNLTYTSKEVLRYWPLYSLGNGSKQLHQAEVKTVNFTYDAYAATYSLKIDHYWTKEVIKYIKEGLLPDDLFTYAKSDVKKEFPIFNEKYIKFDFSTTPVNGKMYDKSPIQKIFSYEAIQGNPSDPIDYNFKCSSYTYRRLGYKEMPIFLFGTNQQGFDLFKIVFIGLRTSLLLGLFTAAICFAFGLVYGAIAGYFGGTVDIVMQRFTDILSGVPWIVIMTLMILNFGQTFWVFAAALCLTGWIGTAGLTRTQFYRFRGREYILASRTLGANDYRLIFRHILPNAMGTIITSSVLMIPSVIFQEATISYLGLGLKGMNSLGVILSDNQKFLQDYPNLLILPAVVIALIMISFNLFGNGLRDAFNPSLKGSE